MGMLSTCQRELEGSFSQFSCDLQATDLRGKTFDGIDVDLFDGESGSLITTRRSETEELTFSKLGAHKRYSVAVHALYDADFTFSKPRKVVFFTGAGGQLARLEAFYFNFGHCLIFLSRVIDAENPRFGIASRCNAIRF